MSASTIDRPIFIIGCNRSGTTLLFNTLASHPAVWSLYGEAQRLFHSRWPVHPAHGEQVTHATRGESADLREAFLLHAHNKEPLKDKPLLRHLPRKLFQRCTRHLYQPSAIRLLDKTPANCLRVPMLAQVFPDARFVFLVRRGEEVVSSLMEGWKNWTNRSPWSFSRWHYLVPPNWQDYTGKELAAICAYQWIESTTRAWDDLRLYAPFQTLLVRYDDLLSNSGEEYERVRTFCDLPSSRYFTSVARTPNRVFTTGGSAPRKDKWRDLHGAEILPLQASLDALNAQFFKSHLRDSPACH
jgi:hypothetical protein